MGIKYRVLYRQDTRPPFAWHGVAIAYQKEQQVIIRMGRSIRRPPIHSLEELTPAHVRPLPGRIRWGLVQEWEKTDDPLWLYHARRQPEPDVRIPLDDVRRAIWRWTPEERAALRGELAQEDDWSQADRDWQAIQSEDLIWAEIEQRPSVYEQRPQPRVVAVAEEKGEYRTDGE